MEIFDIPAIVGPKGKYYRIGLKCRGLGLSFIRITPAKI
jgi:hypothetical protein